MKSRLFAMLGLVIFVLAGWYFAAPSSISDTTDEPAVPPAEGQQCTSLCLDNGEGCVFGTNSDGWASDAYVYINPRYVLKTGWEAGTTGEVARWISRYGSVTFDFGPSQFAWGGMNEAGLMISTMSLPETVEPASDARPPLISPLWVQYQLDNYGTVEEVIAGEARVRPEVPSQYLVCDRTGDCAVIEFLDGERIVYRGDSLPVQALANSTYQDSLAALADGNYWKVSVFAVDANGPATAAGILKGDWILAVDGVELTGVESLATFYSVIAGHEAGDALRLTVIHPGETVPVTLTLIMAPLPEDTSQYVFPPGVPIQELSLGFMPHYPGDFLTRFVTAAEWVAAFEPTNSDEAVGYAFDALEAVSVDDTVLSAVLDPVNLQIYYRTNRNPQVRSLDFGELDFSCQSPLRTVSIHAGGPGDVSAELVEYSHSLALKHALYIAENVWQVDYSPFLVETLLTGFESFPCMEVDAAALADPDLYVETHPPALPPLVTWTSLMLIRHLWLPWLLLTLASLAFVAWDLGRDPARSRAARRSWLLLVVLTGPFGLLAYWLGRRRNHSG